MLDAGIVDAARHHVRAPRARLRGSPGRAARARHCDCAPGTCERLAESEKAQDHSIVLPLFHQMTDAQQDRVVEVLRAVDLE